MPKPRKCYVRGSLIDVCFRAQQGLPLVPRPAMLYLLKGILARAAEFYTITVCDIVVMGNHIHLLLLVQDPAAVPLFLQYVKRESAHVINRILDRNNHTVWCDSSDDPVVLDPESALKRLVYIYLNPARADLESIEKYPNLTSWQAFCQGQTQEEQVYRIPRDKVVLFWNLAHKYSVKKAVKYIRKLACCPQTTYRVEPFAWIGCYGETRGRDPKAIREEVIATVCQEQKRLSSLRTRPMVGAQRLIEQPMDMEYRPSKRGRRMMCRGATKEIRSRYLRWYDDARQVAKQVLQSIKQGVFAVLPPGFFYPGGYLLSNVLPQASPLALG